MSTVEERTQEARRIWGKESVATVTLIVEMSDPDGAWAGFMDEGMDALADCVEYIYFDDEE